MKFGKSLRRSAAVVAVAVATFVAAGSGAQAAPALPNVLNGVADAQALHIKLQLPTLAELQSTLSQVLGVDTSALPALPSQVTELLNSVSNLDEVVSLNHGEVMHGVTKTVDHALGFANPLTGTLDSTLKTLGISGTAVSSGCTAGSPCTSSNPLPSQVQGGQTIPIPYLGTIKLAGAQSITKNMLDTQNLTGLVDVNLSLSGLLGAGAPLSAVGDQLRSLTDALNTNVIGTVNGALGPVIDTLNSTIGQTPLAPVKEELDKLVTLNSVINAFPDLTKADLLDLSVLTAGANVAKSVGQSGKVGLLSTSNSKIANLDILKMADAAEGWAHIDAINLSTTAFADGVKNDAIAKASSSATGGNIGGLLGVHISNQDLADLLNGTAGTSTVTKALTQAGLDPAQIKTLTGAVDMLYNIAGITVENVGTSIQKSATLASAKAGTLKITVAPKIPVLGDLVNQVTNAASTQSLDFNAVKYVSSGIVLSIEAPNASAFSAMGDVHGVTCTVVCTPHARTGVGTPFAVAFILIGAAILVKRFALAK
ncbi:MAG: hypothetical protein ACXVQ6_01235 [Actinomycetota bacterium]